MTEASTHHQGRPGDGFLAGHSRRAALTAHQQKAGEETMVERHDDRWRERAGCLSVDPELFFPVAEDGAAYSRQVTRAKRVCGRCPVQAACLAWAIECQPDGIAGGMTAAERRRARAARPAHRVTACQGAVTFQVPAGARQVPSRSRSPIVADGKAALARGVPRREVAAAFGVSRRTVERWASELAAVAGGGR